MISWLWGLLGVVYVVRCETRNCEILKNVTFNTQDQEIIDLIAESSSALD